MAFFIVDDAKPPKPGQRTTLQDEPRVLATTSKPYHLNPMFAGLLGNQTLYDQ